jgi:hypothetical protein
MANTTHTQGNRVINSLTLCTDFYYKDENYMNKLSIIDWLAQCNP